MNEHGPGQREPTGAAMRLPNTLACRRLEPDATHNHNGGPS